MRRASGNPEAFKTFQFRLANLMLHEIGGHLFITFLGYGKMGTPPSIRGHMTYSRRAGLGEAGRRLELDLFGGNMEFLRIEGEDIHQVKHYLDYRESTN